MEKAIKDLERRLKELATEFYEATGAKSVDIQIRVTPYEESHRINLEFHGGENRDVCKQPGNCRE